MAKKKVSTAIVPKQLENDLNSLKGIAGRLNAQLEEVIKETFTWVKRHKFLVIVSVAILAFTRYWLEEEADDNDDEY